MIDLTKRYKTKEGNEVRIYATDGCEAWQQIHGAVKQNDGTWNVEWWNENGVNDDSALNLLSVHKEYSGWVNCYPDGYHCGYPTRERADAGANNNRIACIPITFHEGDGL